ncbi:MAG: tyrosine--tRNA ligase [Clostridiales bacterium]|nr:tyrosine--tRNA ligase [Clostridiales bacterium]
MTLSQELKQRGLTAQFSHEDEICELLDKGGVKFYIGFDATADSLHAGSFLQLAMMRRLQLAGHKPHALLGTGTTLVGDPSGKSDMRQMLTREKIQFNFDEVKEVAKRFIRTDGENPAIIVNNADWTNKYTYVEFMRHVGVHFNINTMLAAEAYSSRLEEGGLTFLEMGYMPMQAFDFVHLYDTYGCTLQIGGSDQWGNIVAGTALQRKMRFAEMEGPGNNDAEEIFGLTCPLLLTSEGKKMGKTESGTLWVARERTTVFDFYQYFYNVDDADVEMLLRFFTSIPVEEIKGLCREDIIKAKQTMAYKITELVHGTEEADKVLEAVRSLFADDSTGENAPQSDYVVEGREINVVDLFFNAGFIETKSEMRRLIKQNGASVDGDRVSSPDHVVLKPADRAYVLLKKGKKNFMKVRFG